METEFDAFQVMIDEKSPLLFCDFCGFYPIRPEHAHFRCPSCKMRTSCCEGSPIES